MLSKSRDNSVYNPAGRRDRHSAFIFYYRPDGNSEGHIFCTDDAWDILSELSDSIGPPKDMRNRLIDVSLLCLKWQHRLENRNGNRSDPFGKEECNDPGFLEILHGANGTYVVRGFVLFRGSSSSGRKDKSYLFVMERMPGETTAIGRIALEHNLNRREQEIVQLLIRGFGNKEIAYALGLSVNTVKGYMKLLMRRLRVKNRVAIISALLDQKGEHFIQSEKTV